MAQMAVRQAASVLSSDKRSAVFKDRSGHIGQLAARQLKADGSRIG